MTSKQSQPEIWGLPLSEALPVEDAPVVEPLADEQDDEQVKALFASQPNTVIDPPMTDEAVKEIFETTEAVAEAPKKKKH